MQSTSQVSSTTLSSTLGQQLASITAAIVVAIALYWTITDSGPVASLNDLQITMLGVYWPKLTFLLITGIGCAIVYGIGYGVLGLYRLVRRSIFG